MARNRNAAIGTHARNALSELQLEVQTIGQSARDRVDDLRGAARGRAHSLQHDIEERIAQNPLKAVAVAVGLGLVCGLLCRR